MLVVIFVSLGPSCIQRFWGFVVLWYRPPYPVTRGEDDRKICQVSSRKLYSSELVGNRKKTLVAKGFSTLQLGR